MDARRKALLALIDAAMGKSAEREVNDTIDEGEPDLEAEQAALVEAGD